MVRECENHDRLCSKWRHFEPAVITCAVGWYLRFSLSYRNVEEILTERGLPADHTTIWRWVFVAKSSSQRKINILRDAFQDIKTDVKRLALTF